MTEHTPGPWRVETNSAHVDEGPGQVWCGNVTLCGGKFRGDVCYLQSTREVVGGITFEETAANARLIAAAPDLLAALRALLETSDGFDEAQLAKRYDSSAVQRILQARAAIAKATEPQQ